jgi:hypothetical protein
MGQRSKEKGAEHERVIGRKLSLWLSHGEKNDIFTRNVLSGGSFTRFQKKGEDKGIPGDLAAAHPIGYAFLQRFEVEAKHWADIQADAILWGGKGALLGVIETLEKRVTADRSFILIARQNRRPDLAFFPFYFHACFEDSLMYHQLWIRRALVCRLDDFIKQDPDEFMRRVDQVVELRKKLVLRLASKVRV